MSHLSPSEFIDLADGALADARAAHAASCEACRAQAATVRDALRIAENPGAVPEPSPLFWDHLSARVREAVATEPRPRAAFGLGLRVRPLLPALAILVAVFSVALLRHESRRAAVPERISSSPAAMTTDAIHEADTTLYAGHDEVWAVLTAAAADLRIEDAHAAGMEIQPAAVDRAVLGLSSAELTELGRLLQSEMKRSSN